MTFTEKVKNEIISNKKVQPCCQISALSSFIRGAGTLISKGGNIGFEINSENGDAIEYFAGVITSVFGLEPKLRVQKDNLTSKTKYRLTVLSSKSLMLLKELGIITITDKGPTVNLLIDRYLVSDDCCKRSYIAGAFLGAGSVTVPSKTSKSRTSYHLEFVFSNYGSASDFSEVISLMGFIPKLTERKENFIVYFKNGDEIGDLLIFMGAKKSGFEVKDIVIEKEMNNATNRRFNCDISNINKQIEASLKQVKDITTIQETIGLDGLSVALKQTANLRLENRDATLEELASISGLTKSCLNHRFRKIAEIAKNL
ncbi:MAG: DNA-binding protein WhiA [Clostridia bacterium]|nr:DNA-binding protein WhiA [Clostridia bacterium]